MKPQYTTQIIVTRKAIKHLYLRVAENGEVAVSAPLQMSERKINAFIADKSKWIAQKQLLQKQRQLNRTQCATGVSSSLDLSMLKTLTVWGAIYPIIFEYSNRNQLSVKNGVVQISARKKLTPHQQEKLLTEFYREQLMSLVAQYVECYQPIIGVKPAEIRSKQMKTKWGTCNRQAKRLWFNVQLAKYPKKCTEYVVVHEMTHLLERYHNQRFYQLVAAAMPDWREWHHYLKAQ